MEKIILTGDRPTGKLHLGHYVGSLKQRVELQNKGDYIALTTNEKSLVVKTTKVKLLYHTGGWVRVA